MSFDEYTTVLHAFRDAFGLECERPTWSDISRFTEAAVIAAIAKVASSPRTKFYTGVTLSDLVVRAATLANGRTKRRNRRQHPGYAKGRRA